MGKLSGKSGRIKIGAIMTITGVTIANGIATITCANILKAGMFVLLKSTTMTDLNNGNRGLLVTEATSTTFKVALASSQTWGEAGSGTAQRILPITDWKKSPKSTSVDVSDSESGEWEEREIAGHKSWTFTYSALLYDGQGDLPIQEKLPVELDVDEDNYWGGTAIFESYDVTCKLTDAVQVTGNASGSGALTKNS